MPLARRHRGHQRPTHDTRSARGIRNDRLVALAKRTHRLAHIRLLRDVGAHLLGEIEAFFVFYNERFETFTPTGRAGSAVAKRLLRNGIRAFTAAHSLQRH